MKHIYLNGQSSDLTLLTTLLDHPKNRRIHYDVNNMEWLSLEEIKQIVACYDKISVSNMTRKYQLPFLPHLKASMVEEARFFREEKFNPKLAPTRMEGSLPVSYYMRCSKIDWTLDMNHRIVSIPDVWFHPTERVTQNVFYR